MATVISDTTVTNPDGSTTETITYSDGSQSVQYTAAPGTPVANQQTLQTRAAAALAANDTFRALASPTNAQTVAYVQTVAKELNALIRLALGLFDSTSGT